MRKHLGFVGFAFAAAVMGFAMIAWAKASVVVSNDDVIRPKVELASPAFNPNLPFQVLTPVY
jgi:hypothetical protein